MYRPRFVKVTHLIINNLAKQTIQSPEWLTGEFYQVFKAEILPVFYNLLPRTEAEGVPFNSSHYPKSRQRHCKKTIYKIKQSPIIEYLKRTLYKLWQIDIFFFLLHISIYSQPWFFLVISSWTFLGIPKGFSYFVFLLLTLGPSCPKTLLRCTKQALKIREQVWFIVILCKLRTIPYLLLYLGYLKCYFVLLLLTNRWLN